jgi:hypothetical protein
VNGHFAANLDPLNLWKRELPLVMDPELYGFTNADMDRECVPLPVFLQPSPCLLFMLPCFAEVRACIPLGKVDISLECHI